MVSRLESVLIVLPASGASMSRKPQTVITIWALSSKVATGGLIIRVLGDFHKMTLSKFERIAQDRKRDETRQFDVKTELADLVDAAVSFNGQALLDQVAQIEETRHLIALVDTHNFQEDGIDLTITCAKSGNVVHSYSIYDFLTLKEIHGTERATEILQARQFSAISPAWLYTDARALDALQIHDPYGYCVHAASLIILPSLVQYRKLEDMPFAVRADWHKQKATANQLARKIPLHKLVELNELLRRFLAIVMPGKARLSFSYKRLDQAMQEFEVFLFEIKDNIKSLLEYNIKKGTISKANSYGDVIELQHLYRGLSAFRLQRKPRELTESEHIQKMLGDLFDEADIPRYMSGHEPKFTPNNKKFEQTYSANAIDEMMNAAIAELDKATTGAEPMPAKLSFLQQIALRKKGK